MSKYYHKKKEMSRGFLKKINNRQLLIKSTGFVNMGGCRSAPPYYIRLTRRIGLRSPTRKALRLPAAFASLKPRAHSDGRRTLPITAWGLELTPNLRRPLRPSKRFRITIKKFPEIRRKTAICKPTNLFIMKK